MAGFDWEKFGLSEELEYLIKYELRYVVGIDFGHGQTSAHYAKIERVDDKIAQKAPEKAYILDGERSVIPTQFSRSGNEIRLGSVNGNAYKFFKKSPVELNSGVKSAFDGDVTCRDLVRDYIGEVIKNIEAHNEGLAKATGILYIIGCPSGGEWLEDGNDVAYAEIFRDKAGDDEYKIRCVVVMHESRAALIKLKKEKNIFPERGEGILVMDFGSITADWTFMYLDSQGAMGMLDGSENLGASLIDKKLLEEALGELERKISDLEFPVKALSDTCRAKEIGYNNYYDRDFCDNTVTYALKDGHYLVKNVLPAFLDQITGKSEVGYNTLDGRVSGTWEELCRKFMKKVHNEINSRLQGINIKNVVLTGGASKMYFVREICEEIFGVEVISDSEPSLSVSKGLVYAGLADIASYGKLEEIDGKVDSLLSWGDGFDTLFFGNGYKSDTIEKFANRTVDSNWFFEDAYGEALFYWTSDAIGEYSEESTAGYFEKLVCEKGHELIRGSEELKSCSDIFFDTCLEVIRDYTNCTDKQVNESVEKQFGVTVHGSIKPETFIEKLKPYIEDLWNAVSQWDFSDVWKIGVKEMLKDGYDGSMPEMERKLRLSERKNVASPYYNDRITRTTNVKYHIRKAFASEIEKMPQTGALVRGFSGLLKEQVDISVNNTVFYM